MPPHVQTIAAAPAGRLTLPPANIQQKVADFKQNVATYLSNTDPAKACSLVHCAARAGCHALVIKVLTARVLFYLSNCAASNHYMHHGHHNMYCILMDVF